MQPKETSLKATGRCYKGTFGGSRAADALDRILIETDDAKLFHDVASVLLRWDSRVKEIAAIRRRD
jgi:hypothetical protein